MQLGFVTAILAELSFEEVLRFAADEGFDCVEVMCWPVGKAERKYAGVTHIDVNQLSPARVDDIGGLCDKYKVGISALGYYPNPLAADPAEAAAALEHLRKVIAAAPRLGLKNVNTFIGNDHRQSVEANFARFREVWPDVIQWAEAAGVFIGIENCPMLFSADEWPGGKNLARSPAIWRRMFEAIPSPHLGLNYDPSHLVLQMMDYVGPIYEFRDRLFHAHAKDMKIDRGRLNDLGAWATDVRPHWSVPKIPGLGDVNWAAWISALSDVDYRGPVCIEVEDGAFAADLEARKRSLRISRNVLRPLIG
ncbi:MAG: sugar phosphate isomerase/epimerase [Planctomycetes bacterium]|nr:sugar phosphate isomerase/epimerase [Planctomycetota bacterium]